MITEIDVSYTAANNAAPLPPLRVLKGSAVTLNIVGVPDADAAKITGVKAIVYNVANTRLDVNAVKTNDIYSVTIPDHYFSSLGTVSAGLIITAAGTDESDATEEWILGVADIEVASLDTSIVPKDPTLTTEEATAADSLGTVKEKINEVIRYLKGGVACVVACLGLSAFALDANTQLNDIAGTTTIGEIVAAGGGGGGDVPSGTYATKADLANYLAITNAYYEENIKINLRYDKSFSIDEGDTYIFHLYATTLDVASQFTAYILDIHDSLTVGGTNVIDEINTKVSRADVTNVVRDVLGMVYDEKLKVTWKQVMYDGNLYYVAVTNANITEVGE